MLALESMERLKPIINQRLKAYEDEQLQKAQLLREREAIRKRYQQPTEDELDQNSSVISDTDHELNLASIRNLQDPQISRIHSTSSLSSKTNDSFAYPISLYQSHYSAPTSQVSSESPALPPKPQLSSVLTPYRPDVTSPPPLPSKVSLEPSSNTPTKPIQKFKSKNTTEGGAPLRTVFLPEGLRSKFLQIALPNTRQNLETCGMLCGKLQHNAFFITRLVIPHQESTSDTCNTTHEEMLFNYLDQNDLFILGWIHTHPTQSCFLSSVDIHTQNSYQIMLPEAIAVVCAPQHEPAWGVFRLTDPNGINIIKACPRTGFHPHNEADLYRSAYGPGHIMLRDDIPFSVEDLRLIEPTD